MPQSGRFYKANLHCHTTLSDGRKTPAEIKEIYKELGYSVVAYTEHEILVPQNELTDDEFLAINGFEMAFYGEEKVCHLCILALSPDNIVQPFWNRGTRYFFGNIAKNSHLVTYDETEPDYNREYSGEEISRVIQECRKRGFFVTYNHPAWSRENYLDYMQYNGLNAIEIINGCGLISGFEDYNAKEFDDMLSGGKKVFCVAGDDNHNRNPKDSRFWDSGAAFTMIKADNLQYRTITKALENGNFYASEAPQIYDLYYEDGKVYITCSAVDRIYMTAKIRYAKSVYAEKGKPLVEACFEVPDDCGYFRLTLVDERGRRANTNAYFMEDIIKQNSNDK